MSSIPLFPTGKIGCDQLRGARVRSQKITTLVHAPPEFVGPWVFDHGWAGTNPPRPREDSKCLLLQRSGNRVLWAFSVPSGLIAAGDSWSDPSVGKLEHVHTINRSHIVACTRTALRIEAADGSTHLVGDFELRSERLGFRMLGRWISGANVVLGKREATALARKIERDFARLQGAVDSHQGVNTIDQSSG